MLESFTTNDALRPQKTALFLQILVPHCMFTYLESEIKGRPGTAPFVICHSIDDFIEHRRSAFFNASNSTQHQLNEVWRTTPVFQTWMMQTLRSPAFRFSESQLCRAFRELY